MSSTHCVLLGQGDGGSLPIPAMLSTEASPSGLLMVVSAAPDSGWERLCHKSPQGWVGQILMTQTDLFSPHQCPRAGSPRLAHETLLSWTMHDFDG